MHICKTKWLNGMFSILPCEDELGSDFLRHHYAGMKTMSKSFINGNILAGNLHETHYRAKCEIVLPVVVDFRNCKNLIDLQVKVFNFALYSKFFFCFFFLSLPRNSSLVLLMDTGAGIVGADELNSLVGVSCCGKTKM